MEGQEASVAPVLDREMEERMIVEEEKEKSSQESAVTMATTLTTVVDATIGRMDVVKKEEIGNDRISEEDTEENNEAETEGEEEDEQELKSTRKMSLGPWESEVS